MISRVMDIGGGVPTLQPKEKPPINVVGDVGGRIAIMVVSRTIFEVDLFFLNFFSFFLSNKPAVEGGIVGMVKC